MKLLLLLLLALLQLILPAAAELATVAISTFLLELTIQTPRNLRGSKRQLQQSAEDLIQSTAERHLAKVYGREFYEPEQVLLTVVTADGSADDTDNNNEAGFRIRSSFVGGVVSFPLSDILDGDSNSKNRQRYRVPSRSAISTATLSAFQIPGYGEDFLNDLLEAQHQALEGLLLVSAKSVSEGDSIENGSVANGGLEKIENAAGDEVDTGTTADNVNNNNANNSTFDLSNNIWAIAAVAALGAMFLTILMCTTVLWCDWRKRRERKEQMHQAKLQRMRDERNNGAMMNGGGGDNHADYYTDALRNIPTLEETTAPSPSNSDDLLNNHNNNFHHPANSTTHNTHTTRSSSIIHTLQKSTTAMLPSKSKAATHHLQLSRSIDDEDDDPHTSSPTKSQAAPSVVYSVGEDTTTMLYPAIHRGRQNSRDLSEFDGYSMDGMSAIGVGSGAGILDGSHSIHGHNHQQQQQHQQHPLLQQRNVMYSGEVPRDFDSVWDDESKLHERNLSLDSDSILGKSIGSEVIPENASTDNNKKNTAVKHSNNKAPIVNLTALEEDTANNNNNHHTSKNFLNEFDDESESEGSSHRGAFTLELLKGSVNKSKRKSMAGGEDDDSILGDVALGYGREYMDMSVATGKEEEEENNESDSVVEHHGEEDEQDDDDVKNADAVAMVVPGRDDQSVDSTPSWAGRIKNALMRSASKVALDELSQISNTTDAESENGVSSSASAIFRPSTEAEAGASVDGGEGYEANSTSSPPRTSPATSPIEHDVASTASDNNDNVNTSILSHQTSPNSVKDKFVSSLGLSLSFSKNNNDDDNNSVTSAKSTKSSTSQHSRSSRASAAKSVKSSKQPKALGLTNSMDEEVDEDPADMIENINEMLSECRVILDTDVDGPVK